MYAIISDVHGNLEALSAVLARIDDLGVENVVCLGDIVGYGADPDRCTELVIGRTSAAVRGNHDKAAAGLLTLRYFNEMARKAIVWTRTTLHQDNREKLKRLPSGPLLVGSGFLICHGSPCDEEEYILTATAATRAFSLMARKYPATGVCFFGHTHVALAIEDALTVLECEQGIELRGDRSYLINPGSVGQPRDRVPSASFGVYDEQSFRYQQYRVAYRIEDAQKKIIVTGLPERLAARIAVGV